MAGKHPRGVCTVCGADVAVLRDGTAHEHYPAAGSAAIQRVGSKLCPGSGRPIKKR